MRREDGDSHLPWRDASLLTWQMNFTGYSGFHLSRHELLFVNSDVADITVLTCYMKFKTEDCLQLKNGASFEHPVLDGYHLGGGGEKEESMNNHSGAYPFPKDKEKRLLARMSNEEEGDAPQKKVPSAFTSS